MEELGSILAHIKHLPMLEIIWVQSLQQIKTKGLCMYRIQQLIKIIIVISWQLWHILNYF
jgi:hypothetical protein